MAPDDRYDALLQNPEFILLYVPRDEGRMKLVRPAVDAAVQDEFRSWISSHAHMQDRRPHYALSHLWGIPSQEKEHHMWNEIGDFVDDEHGDPVAPIPMRSDKRQTLLALLHAKPGYWWIDVLCARVSTPLVIMGDIYKYCKTCYAMIDCHPRILEGLSDTGRQDRMKHDYVELCRAKDEDRKAVLYSNFVRKWSDQLQLMYQLTEYNWWKRVWTWQEATLPRTTCLIAESSIAHILPMQYLNFPFWRHLEKPHIARRLQLETIKKLLIISNPLREIREPWYFKRISSQSLQDFVKVVTALGASTRTCMDPVDYVYGVLGIVDLDVPRLECHRAVWQHFLEKMEELIQRLLENDHHRGARRPGRRVFTSVSISSKAYHVDLSRAQSMADVYIGFLDVTYEDVPKNEYRRANSGTYDL